MSITIIKIHKNLYYVTFFTTAICTVVTKTPSVVDKWISDIEAVTTRRPLIIGLDVEWRPNLSRDYQNRVAVLQLCVGNSCLIFQIIHCPTVPESLKNFFRNPNYTFVGVGIEDDIEKLTKDYNIIVANTEDLRDLAERVYGLPELKKAGIKTLAMKVLEKDVDKPKAVSLSRWDYLRLSPAQVKYACVDAFLSFEIGRILIQDYGVDKGRPVRNRRRPCCGIGIGWFLFIIGFFIAGIPWYIGAFILICARYDHLHKPRYICLVAAILAIAVIFGDTNDDRDRG